MSKILIDEATVKLALEALELNNNEWKSLADSGDCGWWRAEDQSHYKQTNEAITALKEMARQPAQRTWVGLTDELGAGAEPMFFCGAKWAERILKEKNNG